MLSSSSATDIGKRRKLNEDTVLAAPGLFVVCDGMGGHEAGEVASRLATDVIASFVARSEADPEMTWPYGFNTQMSYDANRLVTAIKLANRAIFRKASSVDAYTGMGTTVVAALVAAHRPHLTYAHVGDSRVYLVGPDRVTQLTRDDSWANLHADDESEDEGLRSQMKNILTNALGAREEVDFAVAEQQLASGDIVLLCSDGLTNMLPDDRIREIVLAHSPDLDSACHELVSEANDRGGRDNISVILLRYVV